ncbi:ABC transporter ATP-binding protein [Deferrisoma palaeochoriense]
MAEAALETRNLTIRFGGNTAIDNVSLRVEPYTLKSIIGPNGAGKTTLFNLLSGQYRPSSGRVLFHGRDVTPLGPADRARIGIGRSFQLTNLFPALTVLENVRLALQARERVGLVFWRRCEAYPELEERAYGILEEVSLAHRWADRAEVLPHGQQRQLEIAILLGLDPQVLLLDEPTAGMSMEEVPAVLDLIRRIKATRTRTILLVEHKFDMIMALSDSIAVLNDGRLLCDDSPEAVSCNPEVLEAYLGGGVRDV